MDSNHFYHKPLFPFDFDHFNLSELPKNVLMNILPYLNAAFLNKMCIKITGTKLDNSSSKNEIFLYMHHNASYLHSYSIL